MTRPKGQQTAKRADVRRVPTIRERRRKDAAAGPDTLLLAGGLALVILVLGDTVFLTISVRALRRA